MIAEYRHSEKEKWNRKIIIKECLRENISGEIENIRRVIKVLLQPKRKDNYRESLRVFYSSGSKVIKIG